MNLLGQDFYAACPHHDAITLPFTWACLFRSELKCNLNQELGVNCCVQQSINNTAGGKLFNNMQESMDFFYKAWPGQSRQDLVIDYVLKKGTRIPYTKPLFPYLRATDFVWLGFERIKATDHHEVGLFGVSPEAFNIQLSAVSGKRCLVQFDRTPFRDTLQYSSHMIAFRYDWIYNFWYMQDVEDKWEPTIKFDDQDQLVVSEEMHNVFSKAHRVSIIRLAMMEPTDLTNKQQRFAKRCKDAGLQHLKEDLFRNLMFANKGSGNQQGVNQYTAKRDSKQQASQVSASSSSAPRKSQSSVQKVSKKQQEKLRKKTQQLSMKQNRKNRSAASDVKQSIVKQSNVVVEPRQTRNNSSTITQKKKAMITLNPPKSNLLEFDKIMEGNKFCGAAQQKRIRQQLVSNQQQSSMQNWSKDETEPKKADGMMIKDKYTDKRGAPNVKATKESTKSDAQPTEKKNWEEINDAYKKAQEQKLLTDQQQKLYEEQQPAVDDKKQTVSAEPQMPVVNTLKMTDAEESKDQQKPPAAAINKPDVSEKAVVKESSKPAVNEKNKAAMVKYYAILTQKLNLHQQVQAADHQNQQEQQDDQSQKSQTPFSQKGTERRSQPFQAKNVQKVQKKKPQEEDMTDILNGILGDGHAEHVQQERKILRSDNFSQSAAQQHINDNANIAGTEVVISQDVKNSFKLFDHVEARREQNEKAAKARREQIEKEAIEAKAKRDVQQHKNTNANDQDQDEDDDGCNDCF